MHRAGVEHQAAEAFSQFPDDGHDTTDLNDAPSLHKVVPAENANDAKGSGEECHVIDEGLKRTAPGLPAISLVVVKLSSPTEPTAGKLLA